MSNGHLRPLKPGTRLSPKLMFLVWKTERFRGGLEASWIAGIRCLKKHAMFSVLRRVKGVKYSRRSELRQVDGGGG